MPRGSTHAKSGRHDDHSPGRVSSATQASWQAMQQAGFNGSRQCQDSASSRQSSGSKQSMELAYSRQALDHSFVDQRQPVEHQERPSARKAHRQPRDFPFQQEFEPTYSGKEKRISALGTRHEKDSSSYGGQRISSEKSCKEAQHRIQFQNMEPTYQKQKKDSSYGDQRQDRVQAYSGRRQERDPSYESPRMERDPRYANSKHDRDSFAGSSRRERDSYGSQRQCPTNRSSSSESDHSVSSQCPDRDTSPHFSPVPPPGYRSQVQQPCGPECRSHSAERDSAFNKHRDNSGERYPPSSPQFMQFSCQPNPPRQPPENFHETSSRSAQRETRFSSNMYAVDPPVQTRGGGCSTKPGKSSKSSAMHTAFGNSNCVAAVPSQYGQRVSFADLQNPRYVHGPEQQGDTRAPIESLKKVSEVLDNRLRSSSQERGLSGQCDRERSSSRKKHQPPPRDQTADLNTLSHSSAEGSYYASSPCYQHGCAPNINSEMTAGPGDQRSHNKTHAVPQEGDYSSFRMPRQQSFQSQPPPEHRPPRPRRPSTPSSPPPSPYPSRPSTPPLYSSRPSSPVAGPARRLSPKRQHFSLDEDSPPTRRSGGSSNSGLNQKHSQPVSSPATPRPIRRRNSEIEEISEPVDQHPPAEPMAWQQQYLKHLQQQQQKDEQTEGEHTQASQQGQGKQQDRPQRDQAKTMQDQLRREQMRKQQEQMHLEYMKIQQEKLQREHMKQQEDLQRDHMRQLEQLRRDQAKQQQEYLHLKKPEQIQREHFRHQQERLLREQMKQQEKMRREHMKQQEHMQQEHFRLQQEYMRLEQSHTVTEGQQAVAQTYGQQQQRQQQRSTEDETINDSSQRKLPDFIQQRYEQIQQQQHSQLQHQQLQQQWQQHEHYSTSHHRQRSPDEEQVQHPQQYYQPQTTSQHGFHQQRQPQSQPDPRQQFQQLHNYQQPQQPILAEQQPQRPVQAEHGHKHYHQQAQQRNEHLHHSQSQQPQQHMIQYQQHKGQHAQQQQNYHYQQQQPIIEQALPLPPWRQGTNDKDSAESSSWQADSSSTSHSSQNVSPAHSHPQAGQSTSPMKPSQQGNQTTSSVRQSHQSPIRHTHQSPVRQLANAQLGCETLASSSNGNYSIRPEQPPAPMSSSSAQMHATYQTQYQRQPYYGQGNQMVHQNGHGFEAHSLSQITPNSDRSNSIPKKPPWLQDQEAQAMYTQKRHPWQQQTEHVLVYPGTETAAGGTSHLVSSESSVGLQYSGHHLTANTSVPLNTVVASSLPEQVSMQQQSTVQVVASAAQQQSFHYKSSYSGNSVHYQTSAIGIQAHTSASQASVQLASSSQNALPQRTGPPAEHHFSSHGREQQRMSLQQPAPNPSHSRTTPSMVTQNPPSSTSGMQSQNRSDETKYSNQTPAGLFGVPTCQASLRETTTDQECAKQVLIEALNEQIQQTVVHGPDVASQVIATEQSGVQNSVNTQGSAPVKVNDTSVQQYSSNSDMQTYTLCHPFDDSNKIEPQTHTSHALVPQSGMGVTDSIQQESLSQSVTEISHQVVPGNPLDTAVALLNIPESVLDIPSIEQHQVFVLDPPGKQQTPASASASANVLRRNSWHTPENSIAGSGSGSFADDDAVPFSDLGTDFVDDVDDDIFNLQQPELQTSESKSILQSTVNISGIGINDLGLRISSVFSLATPRRRKRRAMSDSVLQEVEVVARQQDLEETCLVGSKVETRSSNSQHNLPVEPMQAQNTVAMVKASDFVVPEDQKNVSVGNDVADIKSCSPDPLAELTKLLFADETSLTPAATTAEDWNLNEAAGVSFEADSVCVPGTPARGEPEQLATQIPHLYTPMPQIGKPMPYYSKDPSTPFPRPAPVTQTIKAPTSPLPACAKQIKEPSASLSAGSLSTHTTRDLKEPMTPWPFPVKEFKEPETPFSSCAMGPPTPLPNLAMKNKDPSVPLPQCAKGSTTPLDLSAQESSTSSSAHLINKRTEESEMADGVFEIRVEDFQKVIAENVEKASKQPIEQAIRELLGDEPADKGTKTSLEKTPTKSSKPDCSKKSPKQPQRKSERISAKETSHTDCHSQRHSKATDCDKDIRDRVKDNWERRCASKNTPKHTSSRSRDSSRDSDKERRCVQLIPEPATKQTSSRIKPSSSHPSTKSREEVEEDKKSCGVRGRRTMTIAGRRRYSSGRLSSTEDVSPDRPQQQNISSSKADKPWLRNVRTLSQDSSEEEQDAKKQTTQTARKPTGAERRPDDDQDEDVFFPNLSRSNSTDSSVEGDAEAKDRGKRPRLSSCESRGSRLSSLSSIGEGVVGENVADLILPVVFPPTRRPRSFDKAAANDTSDILASFHEHKLHCVELEGEHYVVLEELLSKCFPGLPRAEVERARLRDLNLLTRTVHLLGSELSGDSGEAVSVLALPDAARLLHFFHGMMRCPGTDCSLRTFHGDQKHRRDSDDSDSSKHYRRCGDKKTEEANIRREGSLGFSCTDKNTGGNQNDSATGEKGTADKTKDGGEEDGMTEHDGHEDSGSCTSDQTVPYCDGHPVMPWEEESMTKLETERTASSMPSPSNASLKLRRHSSDTETRVRKLRDQDSLNRNFHPTSPGGFSLGGASPLLPPLPTYISPFTPGSMYTVPMDNERVLMECFSAPGSQAPSSVRSAPSVRQASPERADLGHFDEDLFAGLHARKSVSEFDSVQINSEPENKQNRSPPLTRYGSEGSENEYQYAEKRTSLGGISRTSSTAYPYADFADDFDVDESDDVFLEDEDQIKDQIHQSGVSNNTKNDIDISGRLETVSSFSHSAEAAHDGKQDLSVSLHEQNVENQSSDVYSKLAPEAKAHFPLSDVERQQIPQTEITSVKKSLQTLPHMESDLTVAVYLNEKLGNVARENENQCDVDKYQRSSKDETMVSRVQTPDYYKRTLCGSAKDRVALDIPATIRTSKDNTSDLHQVPLTAPSKTGNLPVVSTIDNTKLALESTGSDATIAYGATDEETDGNSVAGRSTQAGLGSLASTGPPELSTAHNTSHANTSPQASPPRIEPIINKNHQEESDEKDNKCSDNDTRDEIKPPDDSDETVEDRVQDFIAHGSRFTPRALVRSNSLPDLGGSVEALASPLMNCDGNKLHIPGAISSRSNSYPGASDSNQLPNSSVPSPATPAPETFSESADTNGEDDVYEEDVSTKQKDPTTCSDNENNECSERVETAENTSPDHAGKIEDEPESNTENEPPDCGEPEFVMPSEVIDGGEICTRATPRRSPHVGDDFGDHMLEWAMPCAAHGSVYCACEGIDIHSGAEVAASPRSPRVGPWLCTPGTPAPATPFCDYSKLIYSPFPVVGGMTPARTEKPDTPVGSPRHVSTLEGETHVCGVKRLAPPEEPPAAKRRSIVCSKHGADAKPSACDMCTSVNISDDKEKGYQTADNEFEEKEGLVHYAHMTNETVPTSGGTDELGEEYELIAAAEECEKSMAMLCSKETSPRVMDEPTYATPSTADDIPPATVTEDFESNVMCSISDGFEEWTSPNKPDRPVTADTVSGPKSYVSTAEETTLFKEGSQTVTSSDFGLGTDTAESSAAAKSNFTEEYPGQNTNDSSSEGDADSVNATAHSLSTSIADSETEISKTEAIMKVKGGCQDEFASRSSNGNKALVDIIMSNDVSDTTSVGTTDSESVNDIRIITLGDSDMDIGSVESEDSGDSYEVKGSLQAAEKNKKRMSGNKRTLTLAEYKERRRKFAESKETIITTPSTIQPDSENKATEAAAEATISAASVDSQPKPTSPQTTEHQTKESVNENPLFKSQTMHSISRQSVLSSILGHTPSVSVPRVQRTESVPAELSRKVVVKLKRSSSFHGQHPATKRFKQEGGEFY